MLGWGSIPNNPILHIKFWKSTLIHKDFQEWEKRRATERSLWCNPNRGRYRKKGASSEPHKRLAQHFLPHRGLQGPVSWRSLCISPKSGKTVGIHLTLKVCYLGNHTTYCHHSKSSLGTWEMWDLALMRTATNP